MQRLGPSRQGTPPLGGRDRAAAYLVGEGARGVTVIANRESDLREAFAFRPPGVKVLMRANHDRKLANDGFVHKASGTSRVLGRVAAEMPPLPAAPRAPPA